MKSIVSLFLVAVYVLQVQSFSTTKDCIDGTVALVKERRNELATEFSLSNKQSSESLQQICEYFIQHNVHTVLLNAELCEQVPNRGKYDDIFELSIYESYVTLLNQLKTYEGGVEIPNSFGQLNDRVVGESKAYFDRTAAMITGICRLNQ